MVIYRYYSGNKKISYNKEVKYMNYIYCWYHHMIPEQERKEISETIRNKNYEKFLYLY